MKIKFGPAGIGYVKEAEDTFKHLKELGLKAAEIPFTYAVYIREREVARKVGKAAERFGIEISIHAPYWINLNSKEKEKIEASKKRILKSAEVGHWLGLNYKVKIVFHCGFYGGKEGNKELAFSNIKLRVMEMMNEVKKNKWNVKLCPELMGKKNVFGSIDEISKLVDETGCGFCIDFAHVLARYGRHEFEMLKKAFPQKNWHCHFSGIEYGEQGEKNHKRTSIKELRVVLAGIPKRKEVVIINESPDPVADAVLGLRLFKD